MILILIIFVLLIAKAGATETTVYLNGEEVKDVDTLILHFTTSDTPENEPPVANAGGPYTGVVGSPVSFNGSGSSDPDGSITRYVWNFGDGSNGTGIRPSHSYATAGTFAVVLTVMDNDGATDSDTSAAVISPVDPPVGCEATLPLGKVVNWADRAIFGVPFPGPRSMQRVMSIPRHSYLAIEFNTRDTYDSGVLVNFEASATVGSRWIAISRCKGDFNVAPLCKKAVGPYADVIQWSTKNWAGYCNLEEDTTYYWNTTFTDGVDPTTSKCKTYCNTTNRVWNDDYQP